LVYSLVSSSSQPKEKTNGHEDAAARDVRALPLPDSGALPKCTQKARFILIQYAGRDTANVSTGADEK